MSDQNDGNKPGGPQQGGQQGGQQQGGDWGNNDGWGNQPNPQPTGEPSVQETPGPQGAQQPSGGEWSGGHANNPNPQTSTADQRNDGWGEGQAQPNANENWGNQQGGQMQQQPPSQAPQSGNELDNNDIIAILAAFFLPGLGQLMLGQKTKGIVMILVTIVTCYLGGIVSIASAADAFLAAKTRKYRQLGEWEFFPDMNQHF